MRKLREIINVITRQRLKRIEVFNEGSSRENSSNLYYKLYKGVKEGTYKSDEDAAADLFDTDPSDKKYLMLKSRVKNRLLNNLFFLRNKRNNYHDAMYRCNRNLFAGKFLVINSALETGYSILKSTYQEAEKYQFTDVMVQCLKLLRNQSAYLGLEADFRKFSEALRYYSKVHQAEIDAEEYYLNIAIRFAKSTSPKPELRNIARDYLEEVETLLQKFDSNELRLTYYRLQLQYYPTVKDYQSVIEVCKDAEKYLDANERLAPKIRYAEFGLHKMVGYMHLRDYENGITTANQCLKLFGEGSYNWMTFQEYYFILAMHTRNYDKAREVYDTVVSHPRFENAEPRRVEKWKIFEAYLNYIIEGSDHAEQEEKLQSRFRLFKFLNEVPIYSKDKRGLNVAILILQILFLLDRRDFNGIINRTEALKVYCSRYLRSDENYRSNCFLKMMLLMEKKNFNLEQTRKIAKKYYHKLEDSQSDYKHGGHSEIEIIPYEHLWQLILSKLGRISL